MCTVCEKRWCTTCVKPVGLVQQHAICPTCGHLVKAAWPVTSGTQSLGGAISRAITTEGLITAFAFAVFHLIAQLFKIFDLIYLSTLVGYYFTIVHHVGDGRVGLPGPSDATDDWVEIVGLALRGMACFALGFVPIIVVLALGHDPSPAAFIGWLAVGQLYLPAAILAVTLTNSGLSMVWPVTWVQVIARAPLPYVRFLVLWLGTVAIGCAIGALTSGLAFALDNIFVDFAVAVIWNLFWFAQASLVGTFIRENATAFGW